MTPEQFCYWLQGFIELSDKPPSENQWDIIQDHINTVFNKVTKNSVNSLDDVIKEMNIPRRDNKRIC